MQPMYVWLEVMVVDLLAQFFVLTWMRATRQYGNSLADEYLLRTLVQRNHAEPFITA